MTITISADGMTMTQVVTVKNAKGQPFTTVVYDKQPEPRFNVLEQLCPRNPVTHTGRNHA